MAPPSARTLQRLANETGYQSGTPEKVLRLLDLLSEIARDPILSDRLALKGGTALNVFHDRVLDHGEVDADLLDIDPEIRSRIEIMPMLAWKTRRVRRHRGRSIR